MIKSDDPAYIESRIISFAKIARNNRITNAGAPVNVCIEADKAEELLCKYVIQRYKAGNPVKEGYKDDIDTIVEFIRTGRSDHNKFRKALSSILR